jgi:hypothetical protein
MFQEKKKGIGNDLEGSGRDLIELLTNHSIGIPEENPEIFR